MNGLAGFAAVSAVALLGFAGGAPRAEAASCNHADVVFYSTDTARLAQRLHLTQSACDDYYITVTPAADGSPRAGVAPTVHSYGPQFHALPEIRVAQWAAYAAAHSWYDAGVEVRRRMVTAGFDVSLGDTWAIDEVGFPSGAQNAVDVFEGNGSARQDFRDFVRGLATGDTGMPAAPGLVFAADPAQVTTDLAPYELGLQRFYDDSAFWTDMSAYVRFWAQEAYSDVRAWGVPGSTLADRSSHLQDYLEHGLLLVNAGPGSTDAARSFLDRAYLPLGNAAWAYGPPELNAGGIGYGDTSVALPVMESFVSSQLEAMRSYGNGRFGFAWVPKTSTAPAASFVSLLDSMAASIQASDADPEAACGADGSACTGSVDGAAFTDAWKSLAVWSPPTNTPEGANVAVQLDSGVSVTFATVSSRGSTGVLTAAAGAPPDGVEERPGTLSYDVETTAATSGPVTVCIAYDPAQYDDLGYEAQVFQQAADGSWTTVANAQASSRGIACGTAQTLGTFAVLAADPSPPVVTPQVDGPPGANGWFTGDVTVSWNVSEPQSPESLVTTGCDAATVTSDTAGTTLTCSATSDGGTATASVTIRRDTTPPRLSLPSSPLVLDATGPSGAAAAYAASATDAIDPAPAVACAPVTGAVLAIGDTNVSCTATDAAGNQSTGSFVVHVEGAAEQVRDLVREVANALRLPASLQAALLAPVDSALAGFDPANAKQARTMCIALRTFTALVQGGERLGLIPRAVGDPLVADAARISAVLGC